MYQECDSIWKRAFTINLVYANTLVLSMFAYVLRSCEKMERELFLLYELPENVREVALKNTYLRFFLLSQILSASPLMFSIGFTARAVLMGLRSVFAPECPMMTFVMQGVVWRNGLTTLTVVRFRSRVKRWIAMRAWRCCMTGLSKQDSVMMLMGFLMVLWTTGGLSEWSD